MTHLFSPAGDRALDDAVRGQPLIALDFDGTLAPIVSVPDNARAPRAISRMLERIALHAPVAIITGRAICDVTERLGFAPHYIVGNHGAEGMPNCDPAWLRGTIEGWLTTLNTALGASLEPLGVSIEDKGLSLSLHYRFAHDRAAAEAAIERVIATMSPQPRIIGGKFVANLIPQDAPDKFRAAQALAKLARAGTVIFAGDDVTDDVVFEHAPSHWLTIRVEPLDGHRARFHLNHQNEVAIFLQRLLRCLELHSPKISAHTTNSAGESA